MSLKVCLFKYNAIGQSDHLYTLESLQWYERAHRCINRSSQKSLWNCKYLRITAITWRWWKNKYWESQPHLKGTVEFITIFVGCIEINTANHQFTVAKGGRIRFRADNIHSYKITGNKIAILHMILYNPQRILQRCLLFHF